MWVLPTPGFARYHAALTVPYGALDLRYRMDGREVTLPPGIAHFLEHQVFSSERGDAFEEFARLGASANAFTSYDQTTYLFSTTDRFHECLALLLSFLQEPAFSRRGVEKEKSIIEQEIRMYDDMPTVRGSRNLREALYSDHPLRYDVGGSVDSIQLIDADMLRQVHDTFYHPARMILFVAGDLEPASLMQHVEAVPSRDWGKPVTIQRHRYVEPGGVLRPLVEVWLPASIPFLQVGFRDARLPSDRREVARREILAGLIHYCLFGKTSDLYWDLYQSGLAGNAFSAGYEAGDDYGLTVVAAETEDPRKTADKVLATVEAAQATGLDEDSLERARKKMLGNLVSMFNHPESVGQTVVSQLLQGLGPLELLDMVAGVTPAEANRRLLDFMDPRSHAVSIVWPASPGGTGG
ncbi:MAG: pitrilysin family protein [Bacillota bacterium]